MKKKASIGFNNLQSHVIPQELETAELRAFFKQSGVKPLETFVAQPITRSPLLLLRYRQGEFHSVAFCGEPEQIKRDHFLYLKSPAPEALTSHYLSTVDRYLAVDSENLFVLGQLNVTWDDLASIRKRIPKLTSYKSLLRYILKYDNLNNALASMLHFHALDVLGLSAGKVRRVAASPQVLHQHLQSLGFRCLHPLLNGNAVADTARHIVSDKTWAQRHAESFVDSYQRQFHVHGLRLTPFFPRKSGAAFDPAVCLLTKPRKPAQSRLNP